VHWSWRVHLPSIHFIWVGCFQFCKHILPHLRCWSCRGQSKVSLVITLSTGNSATWSMTQGWNSNAATENWLARQASVPVSYSEGIINVHTVNWPNLSHCFYFYSKKREIHSKDPSPTLITFYFSCKFKNKTQ
jgi:hypothetical protein